MPLDLSLLQELRDLAGPASLIEGDDLAPLLSEGRGRWPGHAPLGLAPANTQEAARLMAWCHTHDVAVVPQGGNTGLVGGQVPNGEVLVSTSRMRTIRSLSPENNSIIVDAGVTLAETQQAAENVERLFPLSIGSEGSCQIGGVVSSNAGGVNVLRYGNMRDLVLGLEVVLPDGRIWNGLNLLRKNNTGYDLKHLFIGGEGTLGLVTAAALKLYPRPREQVALFAAVPDPEAAVRLLSLFQDKSGNQVTSFELISRRIVELVVANVPGHRWPLRPSTDWYVLAEFSAGTKTGLQDIAEQALETALAQDFVTDAVLPSGIAQTKDLWSLRHHASEALKREPGWCLKCDISVPVCRIPSFLESADKAVLQIEPAARLAPFGHVGDGNIHYDVLGPDGEDPQKFRALSEKIIRAIHDVVVAQGGSISAEHGIGQAKRDELAERADPVEKDLKARIKQALDPRGLMNPGKLL